MNQIRIIQLRRFIDGVPTWLLSLSLVLPLALGFVGWRAPVGIHLGHASLLLSALAGAQASVLAIVFSVTLLGIQLVTTRYASRMSRLFTGSPIFKYTFGVFVISIGVDFIILYNLSAFKTRIIVGCVFFAGGTAIVAAISLAAFIPMILDRSTPDGLVAAFEERLQPDVYFEESRQYCDSGRRADHPLQPLHSLIMSALTRREWATAEVGLRGVENIAIQTINTLSESGDIPRQKQTRESKALFKIPLEESLSEITLHAFENDKRELVRQAINVQSSIGQAGVRNYRRYIAVQAAQGLANSIQDAPPTTDGNVIRTSAFQELGQLLREVTELPDPYHTRRILEIGDRQTDLLFRKEADLWVYSDVMLRYFSGSLPDVQEKLLSYYGDYLPELDIDWRQRFAPHEPANSQLLEVMFKWREIFLHTSRMILRYRDRHDEYPLASGNFFSAWTDVCIDAAESEATDYAVVLCEMLIESAYEGYLVDEDSYTAWATNVVDLKEENSEVVERAFQELRTEGRTNLIRNLSVQAPPREVPSDLRELFSRVISGNSLGFDEWLDEFEEDVEKWFEE